MATITNLGEYALNPRGNIWFNDKSTLGHKLLMKMGWSKGKGLGKNEDGIKENIKIKLKSTNSGVGFKDKSFFKIQSTEYDSLLKSISENCPYVGAAKNNKRGNKQESLEQRSQTFKNRLHYGKFVKEKDMSNYSHKDMKSIFILNKISDENKEKPVQESSELVKKESGTDKTLPNLISTYSSNISISDYFAEKMKEKLNVRQASPNSDNVDKEDALPSTQSVSGRKRKIHKESTSSKDTASGNLNLEPMTKTTAPKLKIKKKQSEYLKPDSDSNFNSMHITQETNYNNNSEKPKKKRKKSKSSEILYPPADLIEIICPKFVKHTEEELPLSPPDSVDIKNCESPQVSKQSRKHRSKHLLKLRSCLRNKSSKYCVKNVTFDENVSYQVIEPICKQNSSNFVDTSSEPESVIMNSEDKIESFNKTDISVIGESKVDSQNINVGTSEVENGKISEIEDEGCSLSNLPSHNCEYFNSWVESQRIAMTMKIYKDMFKNIKKDIVLGKSNLLSIRGYGNWGF